MCGRLITNFFFALGMILGLFSPSLSYAAETPQDSLTSLLQTTKDVDQLCEIYVHLADLHEHDELVFTYWEKALTQALEAGNGGVAKLALDYLIFNNRWYGRIEESTRFVQTAEGELTSKDKELFCAYMRSHLMWQRYSSGDMNEILRESLEKLRSEGSLTGAKQIEWEFLTALSIDCAAVANGVPTEIAKAVPYIEEALALLATYPLEERFLFELLCYRKLADLYMGMNKGQEAALISEKIMLLHEGELKSQVKNFGFKRIYYNDDSFYYEEYARLLFLPNIPSLQRDRYFSELQRLKIRLNKGRDRSYWEALSFYYLHEGDYRAALVYNDSVMKYSNEDDRPAEVIKSYMARVSLYQKLGDYKNAFEWLNKCDSIHERLHSDEIKQSMAEMRTRFSVDKLTLDKLQADDQRKMVLLIAIFIVTIGVVTWGIHQRLMVKRLKKVQDELITSNEEVKKQSLRAEESEKMKSAFIDSMCHEIRTPLNAINGFTDLYFTEGLDEEMRMEFQKQIQENTGRLTTLLDTMLELAKLVSSDEELPTEPTDVYGVCLQQMDMLQMKNTKPEVTCVFEGEGSPYEFYSNSVYLTQVVTHLLDNAMKFTERGEIRLTCLPNQEKRCMEISVSDTGIGISADKQEWVFERFTKVDAFVPGTGLGLYLCRLIINKLNGTIRIDSDYESGCKIVIELPCMSESMHLA